MENIICLDTDIVADLLRGKPEAVQWVKEHEVNSRLTTTTITLFELYYGAYKAENQVKNAASVDGLLGRLDIFTLTEKSAKEAGKQLAQLSSEGRAIEFNDILIGAITLTEGSSLKTKNTKHFSRMKELVLVS